MIGNWLANADMLFVVGILCMGVGLGAGITWYIMYREKDELEVELYETRQQLEIYEIMTPYSGVKDNQRRFGYTEAERKEDDEDWSSAQRDFDRDQLERADKEDREVHT